MTDLKVFLNVSKYNEISKHSFTVKGIKTGMWISLL